MVIPIIISSFFLSIITSFYCQKLFFKKKIFDKINLRSSHNSVATRSGGLSVFIVLMIISIYCYLNGIEIFNFSLLVPLSIVFLVGIYDDFNGVDFKLKFIFQIIVAKIIIDNGLIIDNFHGVFGIFEINRVLAQLVTIFIIISRSGASDNTAYSLLFSTKAFGIKPLIKVTSVTKNMKKIN